MRAKYIAPSLTRVASISDMTLGGNAGLLLDVCLGVDLNNVALTGTVNVIDAGQCSVVSS